MKRYRTIALVALLVLAATMMTARAQAPGKIYRVAILVMTDRLTPPPTMVLELTKRGFIEGRNLVFELRVGPTERLPDLAHALLETHPDVIVARGLPAARVARATTKTVPIIAISSFFLEAGLADSFARPGGNLSGVTIFTAELNLKRLELLRELVPAVHRVALLYDSLYLPAENLDALKATANDLGIAVEAIEARRPEEIAGAIRQARTSGAQALNVLGSSIFTSAAGIIAAAAIDVGLPTICQWDDMAEAGCLASYGATEAEVWRTVGVQVARILQGARVAELPVEQPTQLKLVINLKTAKALGLTVPASLLARADEVIE